MVNARFRNELHDKISKMCPLVEEDITFKVVVGPDAKMMFPLKETTSFHLQLEKPGGAWFWMELAGAH